MDLLGHQIVKIDQLDFSSKEDFAESLSYYSSSAYLPDNLLYYFAKGDHYNPLIKNILDLDEALVFFAESQKAMTAILKKWSTSPKHSSKNYIASKRQLGILTGTRSGDKKSALSLLLKGQPDTLKEQFKSAHSNFKTKKSFGGFIPDFAKKDTSGYGIKKAQADAKHHNRNNNFVYCYVGSPKFGPELDMTVLTEKAITMLGLAAWIKEGKGASTMKG